jgi:Ca-activated chloride channel homolog
MFELTHPLFLMGLILLPLLVWYFYRSLVDFARWQQTLSLLFRTLIVFLLVLALAGLTLLQPTHQQFVVFALDESLSIGEEGEQRVREYLDRALSATGEHRIAFLSFAAKPEQVRAQRERAGKMEEKERQGTDIASALEVASADIPPSYVPHIILLSDGNQTKGDALKASLRAGVPISTVPLSTRSEPEVQVSNVQVPAQVREGEPFYVEVIIDSNHDDQGTIEVFRGDHKVVSEQKKIKKGENRFRFRQSLTNERLAQFSVRIDGFSDRLHDNNMASGLVFSSGKPHVLLIESDPKLGKPLAWALEQEGILVDVRPAQGMPDSLADLQNYELLMLSNVPANSLSQRQMEVVRKYVQELGGGFIMLGGDQSFGLGGYYRTVIEDILPVRSDFEKEKEKPSLAMVLVIDKSGSMGGEKIELAKKAAAGAVELLGPKDKIGVIAFEGETFWVSDVQPASNKNTVIDKIASIEAGGGTVMAPAMEAAMEALQNTTAKLKHVIILTDGISAPGDFEGIAQNMAQSKITVTTVGVGEDADKKLLEDIARLGNGRYYYTDDPSSVPQIFATASKSAINEQPFTPQVIRPTQVLSGIDLANAPFLLGYVTTRPKPTCEFILATEKGDPLLAWWRHGLGMSAAFTSDAKSRWAAEWLSWPGFSKFWAQLIRNTMRKSEAKGVVVQVEQKERKATVTLDAVNPAGKYLNQVDTELTVIDPQLGDRKLAMSQTAPGRYVGAFDTPQSGAYHLEMSQKQQGQTLSQQTRGLVVGYDDEFRLRPTNEELLQAIARVSGGTYNPEPEAIFDDLGRTASRATPLWPYLVAAAALLFLADVALRRIDFALLLERLGVRKNQTAGITLDREAVRG